MRSLLTSELQRLQDDLLVMGSKVGAALSQSVDSLAERDYDKAMDIIRSDVEINTRYYDIEEGCVRVISTQQPTAGDLRLLTSMISISAELERIGDYAKGIAKISLRLRNEQLMKPLIDIPQMAEKVRGMLHRSLLAFSYKDVSMARTVPLEDEAVDQLYDQVYRELFTYMLQNPENINQGNQLLYVAHNLERAADRCTNICQRVVYTATGQIVNLEPANDADVSVLAYEQMVPVETALQSTLQDA